MIGGPCHRCGSSSHVDGRGHWCRFLNGPATGNGCYWFRCPSRCPMPDGNGTICLETGALLPAGPCPADCEHRRSAERRRRA